MASGAFRAGKLEIITSGVFKSGSAYVKILSELYDRSYEESLAFESDAKDEVFYAAKKYNALKEAGLYPEGTQFLVIEDSLGLLSVAMVMPGMEVCREISWLKAWQMRRKAKKVLGIKGNELSGDLGRACNYGIIGGKVYYFDLHVSKNFKGFCKDEAKRAFSWV